MGQQDTCLTLTVRSITICNAGMKTIRCTFSLAPCYGVYIYRDGCGPHNSLSRFAAALIEIASTRDRCRRNTGVKFVRLPRHVKSLHYAWVMLGIAIAMRLVSSVERTASEVLVAYLV